MKKKHRTNVGLSQELYDNIKLESIRKNRRINDIIHELIEEDLHHQEIDESIDVNTMVVDHILSLRIDQDLFINAKMKSHENNLTFQKYIAYLILKNIKNKLIHQLL